MQNLFHEFIVGSGRPRIGDPDIVKLCGKLKLLKDGLLGLGPSASNLLIACCVALFRVRYAVEHINTIIHFRS